MSDRLLRVLSMKEVIGYVASRLAQRSAPGAAATNRPKAKTRWL